MRAVNGLRSTLTASSETPRLSSWLSAYPDMNSTGIPLSGSGQAAHQLRPRHVGHHDIRQ